MASARDRGSVHGATLLHYVAANGVEDERQRSPGNAPAIAKMLLEAGADPNALCDAYESRCTTLSLLVSSRPPVDTLAACAGLGRFDDVRRMLPQATADDRHRAPSPPRSWDTPRSSGC
jgi:hypothetical protein